MKIPSLHSLIARAGKTFLRFPLALIFTLTGVIFVIKTTHYNKGDYQAPMWYWNVMKSAYLGMLLQIALTTFAERRQWSRAKTILLLGAGAALAIIYYFSLPDHFMDISMLRLTLFALGMHWLIAFIPFTGSGEMNGFWQYNKILFLRILTAALYSGVLYAGLALALLAIENLFKAHVDYKWYLDLWVVLAGLFNTWFFLSGFPDDYSSLEERTDYPKGLKIFTQYVLLPIITIYLLILYAYMGRIIINAQWPVGWVSNLVLGFSVAGILSLLLIHPIRNETGNKWIGIFSKFFYIAVFPLLILLFLAIYRRVGEYGITESRYFVLLLALWLGFIAIYFLVSSAKNIKMIPISLCLIAFLSSFGPWGAFHISIMSQKHRLTALFEKNQMLVGGKLIRVTKPIPFADRKKISSTIEYLVNRHGYQSVQPYFAPNLDSALRPDYDQAMIYDYGRVNKILSLAGLDYVNEYQTDSTGDNSFYLSSHRTTEALDIEGYRYMIEDFQVYSDPKCVPYLLDSTQINICFKSDPNTLTITGLGDPLTIDVDSLIRSLQGSGNLHNYNNPMGELTQAAANRNFRCKIVWSNINGSFDGKAIIKINNMTGDLLVGKK